LRSVQEIFAVKFDLLPKVTLRNALIVVVTSFFSLPSPAQQLDISAILRSSQDAFDRGNFTAALTEAQKLEQVVRAQFGVNHTYYGIALNNLATVYEAQGRAAEAEGLYLRALEIREKALGPRHLEVAIPLNNVAKLYSSLGRYGEAEELLRRALSILEEAGGTNRVMGPVLGNLADVYRELRKYGEAETLFHRALAFRERTLGATHPDVATALNGLALMYYAQGRLIEAEGLYQRALAIRQNVLGSGHPEVAKVLNNLGLLYQAQGKNGEAEKSYQGALAIREKALSADHPDFAPTLTNLANVYLAQKKVSEAWSLYMRALTIQERTLGANHPEVGMVIGNLANIHDFRGEYVKAVSMYQRALAILEKAYGSNHPATAFFLNNLAHCYASAGDTRNALNYSRRATSSVVAHAEGQRSDWNGQGLNTLVEQRANYFDLNLANLAAASRSGIEPGATLGREAFEIAQRSGESSAAMAIQQVGQRIAANNPALAAVVRENQDLSAARRDREKLLVAALSKPDGQQEHAAIDALRRQLANVDARRAALVAQLEKQFPDYAAFTNPKPLKVEDVQKLLGADEALTFLFSGGGQSYVFALTREKFEWQTIPLGAADLGSSVAAFRRGLDPDALHRAAMERSSQGLFDLDGAHNLYKTLIGPIEPVVKTKRNVLVVATGALTALPFHLLVTEKPGTRPSKGNPTDTDLARYRGAAWVAKRQAVTVLPSVASLKTLRSLVPSKAASNPIIGFGDPVFGPESPPPERCRMEARTATARAPNFWPGAAVDRADLAQALCRLADSADELKAIAQKLGAPASDIRLREQATETNVKYATLSDYRIVYFATHGLVAGDIKGLGEPSLALSLPKQPSDLDDGLLTASEVAQLKLNADWVVLSACNTIAGDKPGADALSGLARSFFYAGARALLASHWAVDSQAATRLTTSTFERLRADPKLGRSEALRQAMLGYMGDQSSPENAYPGFWGPFAVIGDGGGR
jgi:CHAT domain-containing protein/tetratricopeptide (TPR) repeat protein